MLREVSHAPAGQASGGLNGSLEVHGLGQMGIDGRGGRRSIFSSVRLVRIISNRTACGVGRRLVLALQMAMCHVQSKATFLWLSSSDATEVLMKRAVTLKQNLGCSSQ